MGPHQGRVEGKENFPRPAAHTPFDAPQDPIGLLGTQGTLLAHGHPVIHQDTQVPLHRAALQLVLPGLIWGFLFQLQILCEVDHFKVAVNDAHLLQYSFREKQLSEITKLCIAGDITLTSVLSTMI